MPHFEIILYLFNGWFCQASTLPVCRDFVVPLIAHEAESPQRFWLSWIFSEQGILPLMRSALEHDRQDLAQFSSTEIILLSYLHDAVEVARAAEADFVVTGDDLDAFTVNFTLAQSLQAVHFWIDATRDRNLRDELRSGIDWGSVAVALQNLFHPPLFSQAGRPKIESEGARTRGELQENVSGLYDEILLYLARGGRG